ncbi:aldose 1-epimerase family protein [Pedobacter frigoris]|uniref:Aldose 1-epimerase family protein n=1 Tax=Pedobacter frigoris TaxID=2571272 RepID=A0A4U1CHU2_9SPHI|nr:aldose 1-epimerase family protein [Pedobacter frigoris]TKC06001.1 aldose 1-epimerase family protein [Pedobacter frigoris]
MIFLENEHIKASFSTKGAELQSLKNKKTDKEYMWSGDAGYWGKFSPILFPIVGGLKNNTYFLGGVAYELPRHGFARDHEFEILKLNESEVIFNFQQNDQTLKAYPFEFSLSIHYELSGAELRCNYIVKNTGNVPLLFSIGGHPAFATPTENDLNYTDYFLEFNHDSELTYHKIKQDLIDERTETIKLERNRLPLNHELFYDDALVFKGLKSDRISLKNIKNPRGLHFSFTDFPFFGIWGAKNANFLCLEPWYGIADGINHNQNLEEKEGIIELEPLKEWNHHWKVEPF